MWKKIAVVVVVLILGLLGYAATQPSTFEVVRSETIQAPADKVLALIADFHAWEKWSPWDRLDPQLKRTYSGSASGVGAIYEWKGNDDVGSGRMTITAVEPGKSVSIKVEFTEPFAATNPTLFSLEPSGSATKVSWKMNGDVMGLPGKVIGLFMNMDAMIGKDFESGLDNLKAIAEKN